MLGIIERIHDSLLDETAEDYVGLYELVWDVATNAPEVAAEHRVPIARALVHQLIEEHGGELYVTREWPPATWHRVPSPEWHQVLAGEESWIVPEAPGVATRYWVARRVQLGAAPNLSP